MADDISKEEKKLAESTKKMNNTFKNLIGGLAEINMEVAQSAADVRNSTKATFSGYLAQSKLRKAMENEDRSALLAAQAANKKAKDSHDKEFNQSVSRRNAQKRVDENQAKLEESTFKNKKQRQDLLDKINKDQEIVDKETSRIKEAHAVELERTSAEVAKATEDLNEKFADASTSEGFDDFNDAFNNLTGIDIGGGLDKVVETFQAIKTVSATLLKAGKAFFGAMSSMIKTMWSQVKKLGVLIAGWWASSMAWLASMWAQVKAWWTQVGGMKGMLIAFGAASMAFLASMWAGITAMWGHVKKFALAIPAFIAASIAFVASMWTSLTAMASAALAMLAPALPFILIGLAIVALAAMLIWGGMMLYEKSETFREIVDVVMGYFSSIIEAIGRIFSGFYDFFVGLFTGDFDMMFGGIKDVFGGLWDLIKAPFVAIGDFFKSVFDIDVWSILRGLASNLLPGWVVDKIFGAESAEPEPEVKQSKPIDKDVSEDVQDIEDFHAESIADFNSSDPFADSGFGDDDAAGEVFGGEEVDDDFFGDDDTEDLTPPQKLAKQVEEPAKDVMSENRKVEMQLRRAAAQAIQAHKKKESERITGLMESGQISAKAAEAMQKALFTATKEDMEGLKDGTSQTLDDMREAEALATGQEKWQVGDELATNRELTEESYADRNRMAREEGTGAAIADSQKDRLRFDDPQGGAELAGATAEAGQAGGGTQQAIVTNVNQTTSNAAQTVQHTSVPTPRDNDPTGARLAAVPA